MLDKIASYKEEVIGNPNELYEIINNLNITDKAERKVHVKNAREIKSNKDEELKTNVQNVEENLSKEMENMENLWDALIFQNID